MGLDLFDQALSKGDWVAVFAHSEDYVGIEKIRLLDIDRGGEICQLTQALDYADLSQPSDCWSVHTLIKISGPFFSVEELLWHCPNCNQSRDRADYLCRWCRYGA